MLMGVTIFMDEYGLIEEMLSRIVLTMLSNRVWLVAAERLSLFATMMLGGRAPLCCIADDDCVLM